MAEPYRVNHLNKVKVSTERSDFATVELWCRGRRPRQPVSGSLKFSIIAKWCRRAVLCRMRDIRFLQRRNCVASLRGLWNAPNCVYNVGMNRRPTRANSVRHYRHLWGYYSL